MKSTANDSKSTLFIKRLWHATIFVNCSSKFDNFPQFSTGKNVRFSTESILSYILGKIFPLCHFIEEQ